MQFLSSNLGYFKEYNQPLIDAILQTDATDLETLSVQNELVFKRTDETGHEYYTASIYDPRYEADVFLEGVNMDNTGYIVLGAGNPAILKRILEHKTETSWLFVVETDIRLLRKLLEEVDLSPYLEGKLPRLVLFCGETTAVMQDLSMFFNSLVGYYFAQTEILRTFATWRSDREFFETIYTYIGHQIKFYISNWGNSLPDTLMGVSNDLRNLKPIITSKRLIDFQNTYKGQPIICVSSGPSLDKQLPLLKAAKGKALIVAAATAMRVLLKNGITPDIVCILERGSNSYELPVAGLQIPEETALFGLTLIDKRAFRQWPGPVVPCFKENLANSRFLHQSLEEPFGELYSGNSVAHLCLALADFLGAQPIIMIGQDLAYSEEGDTHSKHTIYQEDREEGVSEQQLARVKNNLRSKKSDYNQEVYLDGYYGGKVKSRELWRQFLVWMENMIEQLRLEGRVINATEGGADIKGTSKMPFAEAVARFCTEEIPPIVSVIEQAPDHGTEPSVFLERVNRHYQGFIEQLNELSELAEENVERIDALFADIDSGRPEQLEQRGAEALRNTESLILKILEDINVSFYFRPLIVNLHVKTNPIARVSSVERLRKILDYQRYFLSRVIEGKRDFHAVFDTCFEEAVAEFGFSMEDFVRADLS